MNRQLINVSTQMNGTHTSTVNPLKMTGPLDFKSYDPKRNFTRYYKIAGWWKTQIFPTWLNVEDVNTAAIPPS